MMVTLKEIISTNSMQSLRRINKSKGYISIGYRLYDLLVAKKYSIKMDYDIYLSKYHTNLQRPYVWTIEQQRELILSMLYGRSIPPIVIVDHEHYDGSRSFQVIDGKQRLMTIMRFMENDFPIVLNGSEVYYSDLDQDAVYQINNRNILQMECWYSYYDEPITDDEKIIIFNFYNFAGTPQEISHKEKLQNIVKEQSNQ